MEEILSNFDSPDTPLQDRKYRWLRIIENDPLYGPGFLYLEEHGEWILANHDVLFSTRMAKVFVRELDAKALYEERRNQAIAEGFRFSDLDW